MSSNDSSNQTPAAKVAQHPATTGLAMPGFYWLLSGNPIKRVPRPLFLSPPQEVPSVTFHLDGWPGVPMRDIMLGTVVINDWADSVLKRFNWKTTVVHLEWPGYAPTRSSPMGARIDVLPNGKHITRQEFAEQICYVLAKFCQSVSGHATPIASGCEQWALTTGSRASGIRAQDVVLLSAHYYRTFWVPEFYVIM